MMGQRERSGFISIGMASRRPQRKRSHLSNSLSERLDVINLLYTLLVGIPASLFLMTIGCPSCVTVIGFPAGLACVRRSGSRC